MIYSHSGDIGDVLAALAVLRQVGGGDLRLFPAACTGYRMDERRVASLIPFLALQPYLSNVEYAPGPDESGINLDGWRQHYRDHLNLSDMVAGFLGVPHPDREQPWLRVDRPHRLAPVVFARSHRWRNPSVDWPGLYDQYARDAVFVGTPDEHADFTRSFGPVSYHYTADYLALARVVAGADLVCANQTSIRWLAEGLKVPVIVEVYPAINNTHWERAGAHYLYGSDAVPRIHDTAEHFIRSVIHRASGRTLLSPARLEGLARAVRGVRSVPGEMAELGSYRGGSAAVIASSCPEKTLHLFDTFTGIPADDEDPNGHKAGEFAADLSEVRSYLRMYDVEYHVGTFPDTVPAGDVRYAFVHLDADTYQSTRAGLDYFVQRMSPGGCIVLDDWDWRACGGVRRAVEERGLAVTVTVSGGDGPGQAVYRKV